MKDCHSDSDYAVQITLGKQTLEPFFIKSKMCKWKEMGHWYAQGKDRVIGVPFHLAYVEVSPLMSDNVTSVIHTS